MQRVTVVVVEDVLEDVEMGFCKMMYFPTVILNHTMSQ